jgi:hypothetical protein
VDFLGRLEAAASSATDSGCDFAFFRLLRGVFPFFLGLARTLRRAALDGDSPLIVLDSNKSFSELVADGTYILEEKET